MAQWTTQKSGTTTRPYGMKAVNEKIVWAVGMSGLVLKTVDGGTTWVSKTITEAASTNYAVEAFDSTTAWVTSTNATSGVDMKVWKTTDGGTTWKTVYSSPNGFGDGIKFFDANTGILWGDPNPYPSTAWEVMKTTDAGTTWTRLSGIPAADSVNGEYGSATSIETYGNNIWFVGYSGAAGSKDKVYRSTDKGATWSVSQVTMAAGKSGSAYIAFSTPSRGLLVGLDSTVARTTDGGATWISGGLKGAAFKDISAVRNVQDMYVAVGGSTTVPQTYITMDGGITWTSYATTVEGLRCVEAVGGTAYAGGYSGSIIKWTGTILPVELSSFSAVQNGKNVKLSWSTATETNNRGFEIERKLNDAAFTTIAFKAGAGTSSDTKNYSFSDDVSLLKATSATYRIKQVDFDGSYSYSKEVVVNLTAPVEYSLGQNYPNPFNPTTSIKFSVANAGKVSIKVFNSVGQEVSTLVNEVKEAGTYEVNFNAGNFSSGVYFYEINAGNFSSTKKMLLMK
jgi:Uncharacterized protein related to plant photosystem II stability/assembly factor